MKSAVFIIAITGAQCGCMEHDHSAQIEERQVKSRGHDEG